MFFARGAFRVAAFSSPWARLAILTACLVVPSFVLDAAATLSRQQSDAFARKLALITRNADAPSKSEVRTPFTEGEVNSWFVYRSQRLLPAGVAPPRVAIIGGGSMGSGRVTGDVVLDLESFGKRRGSGGTFDPWRLLGGRVPVTVTGVLHTKNGEGKFDMQSAEIAGIPVPKSMVQELLSYYSRTPNHPQGIDLNDPFDLPANIRQIEVGPGQAVVIQ
jgi:hypothetical protein